MSGVVTPMQLDVVTIFPSYFAPLSLSLLGRAQEAGLLQVGIHDLRDWTSDRHRTVDDTPYGGGAGMVMKPEPWGEALRDLAQDEDASASDGGPPAAPLLVIPTPAGRPFTQQLASVWAGEPHLIFACGRYEGIDARVSLDAATFMRVEEVSLGDYVLNGGEAAVLVMIEAVARLLPGVLGNAASLEEESHTLGMTGLVEYPVYTKPPAWRDLAVPDVLTSGDHGRIRRWRRDASLTRTAAVRPDLLRRLDPALLDAHDLQALAGLGWEVQASGSGPRLTHRLVGASDPVAD